MSAARKRAAAALEGLGRSDAAEAVRAEPSELRCAAVSTPTHRVRVALEQRASPSPPLLRERAGAL